MALITLMNNSSGGRGGATHKKKKNDRRHFHADCVGVGSVVRGLAGATPLLSGRRRCLSGIMHDCTATISIDDMAFWAAAAAVPLSPKRIQICFFSLHGDFVFFFPAP